MKGSMINQIKPETLEDMVLPVRMKELFAPMIEGSIPLQNLTLHGVQGCGKSTLAKLLARRAGDVLWVDGSANCSLSNVQSILEYTRLRKKQNARCKLVVIEEADGMAKNAQQALKRTIEETGDRVVWLLLTNHLRCLIKELLSRCTPVCCHPLSGVDEIEELQEELTALIRKQFQQQHRGDWTLKHEQVLQHFVKQCYPDVRSVFRTFFLNCIMLDSMKQAA
jgi:replication-associated recombination protein RarA